MNAIAEPNVDRNVDPREAAQFERLAETWWDTSGPFWPLHRLNGLRSSYILERVCERFGRDPAAEQPLAGIRVLDVGCGGGILSEAIARHGADVTGIDAVARNVAIAERHAEGSGLAVRYAEDTAEALVERGEQYDVVLNMEVVEHVPDVASFMTACSALVRPGGMTCIATINRTPASFVMAIVGAEYILRWLPRGTHRWSWFPRPEELETLLRKAGLEVTARTGVRVNPITRRFALTSIMAVNYMLVATRPHAAAA